MLRRGAQAASDIAGLGSISVSLIAALTSVASRPFTARHPT